MTSNDIYAQLALDVYKPSKTNKPELPEGWSIVLDNADVLPATLAIDNGYAINKDSGFRGAIYTNGSEVVVGCVAKLSKNEKS